MGGEGGKIICIAVHKRSQRLRRTDLHQKNAASHPDVLWYRELVVTYTHDSAMTHGCREVKQTLRNGNQKVF